MSRGLGRVQRQIVDLLFEKYPDGSLDTFTAAVVIYHVQVGEDGMRHLSDAQLSAVRRALQGLASVGKVKPCGRARGGRQQWFLASAVTTKACNVRQTAAALGISKSTMWRALRRLRPDVLTCTD